MKIKQNKKPTAITYKYAIMILTMVLSFAVLTSASNGALTPKYTTSFSNSNYAQIMPLMGDIDNDGTQEIVLSAGGNVQAINGKTGVIEWTVPGASKKSIELADINNDGVPEVLYTTPDRRVVALRGDGSKIWTSASLKGEDQPQFPLLAYDVDGDGYPTIYFATEDQNPTTFTGNMSDYTGSLSMLDHNGKVLASTWLFHPCWGGLSIADPNFDGNFILYVSDRRSGYNGMTDAKGLQAYDPKTLEPIWNRGDILSSSPLPVVSDINKDGILDLIGQAVTHRGVAVLNATTGKTFPGMDYLNRNLPTHGAGTVYDIDKDGNKEIILSVDSGGGYPTDFVVFDLITGTEDFHPYFNYYVSWPPEVGDVDGNGDMEILAATGNQSSTRNYPLLIYDKNYNLIQTISITGAGQLMPAKVFDVDSDGLNEVVVAGFNGRLMVYDTPVSTPNPAPRTWVQRYSEYRAGVAEYVEPPGPKGPTINNPTPSNSSQNIILTPMISVKTYDYQKDRMNITFEINDGNGWHTIRTYTNVMGATYTANTTSYVTEYATKYYWRVTTRDAKGNMQQKTFSFTTIPPTSGSTKPIVANENPSDGAVEVPTNIGALSFDLSDNQGDTMTYIVTTSPNVGSRTGTATNGHYTVPISNLQPGTVYTWKLNVSDGTEWTRKTFTFTSKFVCVDADHDGFNITGNVCGPIDCNDASSTINQGAVDICGNGIDEDCSGSDAPCLLTDLKFDASADSAELRNNSPSPDWYESRHFWANGDETLLSLDTANIGGNTGKKALLKNSVNVSTNAYLAQEFGSEQTQKFNVSFDIYIDSIDGTSANYNRTGSVYIGDDSNTNNCPMGTGSERFVVLGFYDETPGGTGNDLYLKAQPAGVSFANSKAWINITSGLSYDKWYNLRIEINPINGTYDVYVDDSLKKTGIPRYSATATLKYITFVADSDARGAFYIDNVNDAGTSNNVTCTDADNDGYGTNCAAGPDCNDNNNAIHPNALDNNCNNIDENCNSQRDEGYLTTPTSCGVGACASTGQLVCSAGSTQNTCVAGAPIAEVCANSIDDDCDGAVDENCSGSTWLMPGWDYRKKIVIDHNQVVGNQEGFPVLIDFTDANVQAHALANGNDFVFTSADGVTKLSFEIESYNNGHLSAWVKTNVSSTANTTLYVYYGNPSATSQETPEAVWDSDYLVIQHMEESSGTVYDSTNNNKDGTPQNGVVQNVAGKIDGADQFDGVNDRTQLPQVFTTQTQFTIEGWMNPANKHGHAISQRSVNSSGVIIQYFPGDSTFQLYVNGNFIKKTTTVNSWHHVVATFDGATSRLFVDGTAPVTGVSTLTWPTQALYIGDRSTGARAFQGTLDEIRISDVARSQGYISTSYNNQNSPSTFFSLGVEETAD